MHAPSLNRRPSRRAVALSCLSFLAICTPVVGRYVPPSFETLQWGLDLISHWQWLWCLSALISVVWIARADKRWLVGCLVLPLPWVLATSSLPWVSERSTAPAPISMRLASANVQVSNTHMQALVDWLAVEQPDVAVILEVSPTAAQSLKTLQTYPYQVVQPDESPFGMALLSKWPIVQSAVVLGKSDIPRIDADIDIARQRVRVVAIHPMPPLSSYWLHQRDSYLLEAAQQAQGTGHPAVLAGDFNATPWADVAMHLQDSGWRRATGLRATWPAAGLGWMGIPIDTVLASPHWQLRSSQLGPNLGSDHLPVVVTLVLQRN